jgi:hypothetical protein
MYPQWYNNISGSTHKNSIFASFVDNARHNSKKNVKSKGKTENKTDNTADGLR